MLIPKECKMPDLSEIATIRLNPQTLLHAFIGDPGVNPKEGAYRRNYARLLDKAIREYQAAREAILDQIAEVLRPASDMTRDGRQIFIFEYVDHFENCVNAINRLLHLLTRLKAEPVSSVFPRDTRRSIEAYSQAIGHLRNAFEHIDELIQKDEIAEEQPVMLSITDDGESAVLGEYTVPFADVATTLRRLHELGVTLFQLRPSDC